MPSRSPTRNVVPAARPGQSTEAARSRPATTLPITDSKRKELLTEMQKPNDEQTSADVDELEIEVIPDDE